MNTGNQTRSGQLTMVAWKDRFWSKVLRTETCWLWSASTDGRGYGKVKLDGRYVPAHRAAYEMLVGPIPEGLTLDHVAERGCTNRHCVNPAHLEPVTVTENNRRGRGWAGVNARKTRCARGHEYTEENTRVKRGQRQCRTCLRAAKRAERARKLAA